MKGEELAPHLKVNCRNIAIPFIDTKQGEGKAHSCVMA